MNDVVRDTDALLRNLLEPVEASLDERVAEIHKAFDSMPRTYIAPLSPCDPFLTGPETHGALAEVTSEDDGDQEPSWVELELERLAERPVPPLRRSISDCLDVLRCTLPLHLRPAVRLPPVQILQGEPQRPAQRHLMRLRQPPPCSASGLPPDRPLGPPVSPSPAALPVIRPEVVIGVFAWAPLPRWGARGERPKA